MQVIATYKTQWKPEVRAGTEWCDPKCSPPWAHWPQGQLISNKPFPWIVLLQPPSPFNIWGGGSGSSTPSSRPDTKQCLNAFSSFPPHTILPWDPLHCPAYPHFLSAPPLCWMNRPRHTTPNSTGSPHLYFLRSADKTHHTHWIGLWTSSIPSTERNRGLTSYKRRPQPKHQSGPP